MEKELDGSDLSRKLEAVRNLDATSFEREGIRQTVNDIYDQVSRQGWPSSEPQRTLDELLDHGGEPLADEWLTTFLAEAIHEDRQEIYGRVTAHLLARLEELLHDSNVQKRKERLPAFLAANYLALNGAERTELLGLLRRGREAQAPGFNHPFAKDLVLVYDSIYDILNPSEG